MKRFSDWLIRYWWLFPVISVVFSLCAFLLPRLEFGTKLHIVILCVLGIFAFVTLIVQLPIFIIALCKKRWWRSVGIFFAGLASAAAFCIFPITLFGMLLFSVYSFEFEPDGFGKLHPIPEGMECNKPLGCVRSNGDTLDCGPDFDWVRLEPTIDSLDKDTWLQIWIGSQPGIYNYDFYYPALVDGEVFLRCFEATENIELSDRYIRKDTSVPVKGHNAFGKIADGREFKIYEGDWGEYYAVRVEVWHCLAKGDERKLLQKIYRMDGWQR